MNFNKSEFGLHLKEIKWSEEQQNQNVKPFHKISEEVEKLSKAQVKEFRKFLSIYVSEKDTPNPILDFSMGNFPDFANNALESRGYQKPTPIQSQAWPIVFSGRNLIGVAETGSGKTLVFTLPAIIHVLYQKNKNRRGSWPTVVVLSPTRELANQIHKEFLHFSKGVDVSSVCVYGGQPRSYQKQALMVPQDVVVGTPGRVIDFLESGNLKFKGTTMFIVDEADRMLDLGFENQLRRIHSQVPPNRQTLFFTATWPKEVESLARDFVQNALKIRIGSMETAAVHSVAQNVLVLDRRDKFSFLMENVVAPELEKGGKVLVFAATKRVAEFLFEKVLTVNRHATLIHGGKTQNERDISLRNFSSGRCPVMIATDVAQRGLDIPNVTCVVNYDFPNAIEDYVHRIGRTGRAGKEGVSFTFLSRDDERHAAALVKVLQEANQEIPNELKDMAENGGEIEIKRFFPKPWAERTEEEKENYNNTPIQMELDEKFDVRSEHENDNNSQYDNNFNQYDNNQNQNQYQNQNNRRQYDGDFNSNEGQRQFRQNGEEGFRKERPQRFAGNGLLSSSEDGDSEDEEMLKMKLQILRKKAELREMKKNKKYQNR